MWNDDPNIHLKCKNKATMKPSKMVEQRLSEVMDKHSQNLQAVSVFSKPESQEEVCKEFILSSDGGTKLYQQSRLGSYKLLNNLVNDRVAYFNEEKKQYLFWINKYDQYWMVSEY